jgi:hypothetical protein
MSTPGKAAPEGLPDGPGNAGLVIPAARARPAWPPRGCRRPRRGRMGAPASSFSCRPPRHPPRHPGRRPSRRRGPAGDEDRRVAAAPPRIANWNWRSVPADSSTPHPGDHPLTTTAMQREGSTDGQRRARTAAPPSRRARGRAARPCGLLDHRARALARRAAGPPSVQSSRRHGGRAAWSLRSSAHTRSIGASTPCSTFASTKTRRPSAGVPAAERGKLDRAAGGPSFTPERMLPSRTLVLTARAGPTLSLRG